VAGHALIRRVFDDRLPALAMFDLDGTLVDSVPDIARALDATLAARGCAPAGVDRVRHWVGRGSRNLVREALAHAADIAPQQLGEDVLDDALAFYLARYLDDCAGATTLMPGAAPLLASLRAAGVALACVTNKPIAITARVLGALLPDAGFAAVLGGDSGAGTKPSPGPLLAAMASVQAPPGAALMIGDSRHDVHAARAAGVRVICVAGGYNHGEDIRLEAPDLVVDGLGELL
jgi:phosphoglycolate phosphatase